MPHPYDPNYEEYCEVLNQMSINNETILVGHSCGAGFLIRYFSEYIELKPKKIVLVAPWLDLEGYLEGINPNTNFFDFNIDKELSQRIHIDLVYSTDDDKEILDSVDKIKHELNPIQEHVFSDKGHFTEPDLGSKEFPELVEIILTK